jgi:hypothetical protein
VPIGTPQTLTLKGKNMFELNQDIFDSRDLIDRLEELEALEANFLDDDDDATQEDVDEWTRDLDDELATLRNFAEDAQYCEDWEYGATFIHEDYFTLYSKELTSDLGYIPDNLPDFIEDNIDWEGVADDLKVDYSEYTLDGNTYYAR